MKKGRLLDRLKTLFKNPIAQVLALGVGLRLISAITDLAIVYPDEHFQVLEPANLVVNGFGWKSWEWYAGTRSWFLPTMYMGVLGFLKLIGIHEGPVLIHACKTLSVGIDAVFLWRFAALLRLRGFLGPVRWITLAILALSPAMIAWSSTTFSDTWLLAVIWIAMTEVLRAYETGDRDRWFVAGMVLGLTFALRVQSTVWAAGLLIYLFWVSVLSKGKADVKRVPFGAFLCGYTIPVVGQGVLDWMTWGRPFYSVYKNVKVNLFGTAADINGRMPWYDYFPKIFNDLGWPLAIFIAATLGVAFLVARFRLRKKDGLVLFPAGLFLLAHSFIGHKETRFILPVLPALFYLLAGALQALFEAWPKVAAGYRRWARPVPLGVGCVLLGALALKQARAYPRRDRGDLSDVSAAVYRDGGLKAKPDHCLLFLNRNWIWTRGEMLFGQKISTVEINPTQVTFDHLKECAYAILSPRAEDGFRKTLSASPSTPWRTLFKDRWGNLAYRNDGLLGPSPVDAP